MDNNLDKIELRISGRTLLDLLALYDYELSSIAIEPSDWDNKSNNWHGESSVVFKLTKPSEVENTNFTEVALSYTTRHEPPTLKVK